MNYLYTIHVVPSIKGEQPFYVSLFYKVADFSIREERRQNRVKSLVEKTLREYHYLKIDDNMVSYHISEPLSIKTQEIKSIIENGIQNINTLPPEIKRVIKALQMVIFYDPYKDRYILREFESFDLIPLNLLREEKFIHIFYLDPKQELHRTRNVKEVEEMFFYPFMSDKMNINVLSLIPPSKSYLDSSTMMIDICKKAEDKIVFFVPEDISLSFIMDLTDVITRDNRVSVYTKMKYKRGLYKICRDGDSLNYIKDIN